MTKIAYNKSSLRLCVFPDFALKFNGMRNINYEYAIRTYIDTPVVLPDATDDKTDIPIIEIAIFFIIIIILLAAIGIIFKPKKT